MKRAAVWVAALLVVGGCAAPPGATNLDLHQQAKFGNGTTCSLSQFEMSGQGSGRATGAQQVPGQQVTVWVELANAGPPVKAADVAMDFAYTDDDNHMVTPRQVSSSTNVVASGARDRVGKTFLVQRVPQVFRSRHIRVVVRIPAYPSLTFSGEVP